MSFTSQIDTVRDFQLPRIGLGTWSLRGEQCVNAVCCALQCGYRLIDTASFYGNEKEVGEAVRRSGLSREKVIIQTKLYPDQYDQASKAIDDALKKLNLDYIDIMMLHHPAKNDVIAYRAIEQAIARRKVRAAGLSCYYIQETTAFLPQVDIQPVLIQNEIHPLPRQDRGETSPVFGNCCSELVSVWRKRSRSRTFSEFCFADYCSHLWQNGGTDYSSLAFAAGRNSYSWFL